MEKDICPSIKSQTLLEMTPWNQNASFPTLQNKSGSRKVLNTIIYIKKNLLCQINLFS